MSKSGIEKRLPGTTAALEELRRELRLARRRANGASLVVVLFVGAGILAIALVVPNFVPRIEVQHMEERVSALLSRASEREEEVRILSDELELAAKEADRLRSETDRLNKALDLVQREVVRPTWWFDEVPTGRTGELDSFCKDGSPAACYEVGRRILDFEALGDICRTESDEFDDSRACELKEKYGRPPRGTMYATAESRRIGRVIFDYLKSACPENGPAYAPGCWLAGDQSSRLAKLDPGKERSYLWFSYSKHLQACRLGYGESCQHIAYLYTHGNPKVGTEGISSDKKRAEGFAIAACIAGDAGGCNQARYLFRRIDSHFSQPNEWLAEKAQERACDLRPGSRFCI